MKKILLLALLGLTTQLWAYSPRPVKRTAAETNLTEALKNLPSAEEKISAAKAALEANGEDARLSITAAKALKRNDMPEVETYLKSRAEDSESITKKYVYSYFYEDSTAQIATADWILKKDPKSFWGHFLWALGEWGKSNPDKNLVKAEFEKAIAADPSQPDGYLYLGWLYEEQGKDDEALAAFEAGAVAEIQNGAVRGARLSQYAIHRNADKYFALLPAALPKGEAAFTLNSMNGKENFSLETLKGKMTLIDFWAYWCTTCIQEGLPELNAEVKAGQVPFQVFAVHRGAQSEKAVKVVEGKDAKGNDWNLNFVWSNNEFDKWTDVKVLPSYFLLDKNAKVRAMISGHPKDTLEIVKWLAEEIEKRDSKS